MNTHARGRTDLADKEAAEVAVLEVYLPQQMSEEDITTEVRAVISELGASGPQDMSKVMPPPCRASRGAQTGAQSTRWLPGCCREAKAPPRGVAGLSLNAPKKLLSATFGSILTSTSSPFVSLRTLDVRMRYNVRGQ